MHQHVKVLEFGDMNNSNKRNDYDYDYNGQALGSNGFARKKPLPHQYKNPKGKEASLRNSNSNMSSNNNKQPKTKKQQPQQVPKKNLVMQDSYENIESIKPKQKALKAPIGNDPNKIEGIEDPKVINTINKIASNPKQYKYTNQMLRAIGEIAGKGNVGFLIQKEDNNEPSEQLSDYLREKLKAEDKAKVMAAENLNQDEEQATDEDHYYNNLVSYIKSEMKKKGKFDFAKLSEKDRKLLAQRKLYDRMGGNKGGNSGNAGGDEVQKEKKEFEFRKEYFSKENVPYENYSDGEDKDKDKKGKKEEEYEEEEDEEDGKDGKEEEKNKAKEVDKKEIIKEKPTARQILENVLSKIEYSNQMFVNNIESKQKKTIKPPQVKFKK